MKTEMKELNLEELEQVNGGCIWCIAAVTVIAAMGAAVGTYVYRQVKNGK